MAIPKILEKFIKKDDPLVEFLHNTKNPNNGTVQLNHDCIVSEIYFIKTLEFVTNKLIKSNTELSNSNKKYTKAMLILTAGLVTVGITNILISLFFN